MLVIERYVSLMLLQAPQLHPFNAVMDQHPHRFPAAQGKVILGSPQVDASPKGACQVGRYSVGRHCYPTAGRVFTL